MQKKKSFLPLNDLYMYGIKLCRWAHLQFPPISQVSHDERASWRSLSVIILELACTDRDSHIYLKDQTIKALMALKGPSKTV